ncbi:MAG: hypothetical protein ACFHWZ_09425 [Phycisphaerales bacterium]
MRIIHIINPFHAPEGSEHAIAQEVTLASIRRAHAHAKDAGLEVVPVGVAFEEDLDLVASPFIAAQPLKRSVIDVADFATSKKFPLVADLIALGADAAGPAREGDVLVYTNLDISLQPHFYASVASLVTRSAPAHVINRRTIPGHYDSPGQLDAMLAEPGERHGGWDCFVFPRSFVGSLELDRICIGAPYIGLAMLANLDALSGFRLVEHKDLHLTFHIGDDATWRGRTDLSEHNRLRLRASLDRLREAHAPVPARSFFERVDAELFERPRRDKALRHRLRRLVGLG